MSILQEYEQIRREMGEKKYDNRESRYVLSHPVIWNKVFKRSILEGELFLETLSLIFP